MGSARDVLETAAAIKLVEDALFLRQYGERPPGAPHVVSHDFGHDDCDCQQETWADWDRRAEEFLRSLES